ncbi:MAG: beta-ketoacyl synthase chain length factor [Polaromonas sp.]|nr:beta-ketoacyl synthase chain length factor [Polaromonas sp.]
MNGPKVYVDAVGLCGPGLAGWHASRPLLCGTSPYLAAATVIPPSNRLPAAEKRRVGTPVKLALAVADDALQSSCCDPSDLLSVFSSSGGDGENCHLICEALAGSDRLLSPTRFTNSVHNAPSGYWGIAMQARRASTSLCAFDGSFSAGLLEAATQSVSAQAPVLLIAYDTPYPEPLRTARPIAQSLGVALLLSPIATPESLVALHITLGRRRPDTLADHGFETLRCNVPAARSLPLLRALALGKPGAALSLDLFSNLQLLLQLGEVR